MAKFCFKKKCDEKKEGESANVATSKPEEKEEEEFVMVHSTDTSKATKSKVNENTWLGDTGATCHMRYSLEGMRELRDTQVPITMGSGKKITGTKSGTWHGTILQTNGNTKKSY